MKGHLLLLSLITCYGFAYSQWELMFCRNDTNGVCAGKSDSFVWNGENMSVYAMLNSKIGITEGKVEFKVFEVKNDLSEKLYADVKATVKPEWKTVSKKIFFVKPGYYKIEVYDNKMNRLASEYITITDRPE